MCFRTCVAWLVKTLFRARRFRARRRSWAGIVSQWWLHGLFGKQILPFNPQSNYLDKKCLSVSLQKKYLSRWKVMKETIFFLAIGLLICNCECLIMRVIPMVSKYTYWTTGGSATRNVKRLSSDWQDTDNSRGIHKEHSPIVTRVPWKMIFLAKRPVGIKYCRFPNRLRSQKNTIYSRTSHNRTLFIKDVPSLTKVKKYFAAVHSAAAGNEGHAFVVTNCELNAGQRHGWFLHSCSCVYSLRLDWYSWTRHEFPDMPCMTRVYRDKKASVPWSAARAKERLRSRS